MARRPKDIRGLKFRPDRGTWEAQYIADGSRVRKNFTDRQAALDWLETAKGLRHKEGVASLPSSALEPILTVAEKRDLQKYRADTLLLDELCDQYLSHIQNPNNPERPRDQVGLANEELGGAALKSQAGTSIMRNCAVAETNYLIKMRSADELVRFQFQD